MTPEKEKEVCKKCRWHTKKENKKTKRPETFCVEGNCFIAQLTKCPL
jgi:hypothetical protein